MQGQTRSREDNGKRHGGKTATDKPKNARGYQKPGGRSGNRAFPKCLLDGAWPYQHPDSDFWPSEPGDGEFLLF